MRKYLQKNLKFFYSYDLKEINLHSFDILIIIIHYYDNYHLDINID